MRAAAQHQAQQAAHRLTTSAIADSALRAASSPANAGSRRSQSLSNIDTRTPRLDSSSSSRLARSPGSGLRVAPELRLLREAAIPIQPVQGDAAFSLISTPEPTLRPSSAPVAPVNPPDALDTLLLQEDGQQAETSPTRLSATQEVINTLDLPGLAALRAELVASHTATLEKIDDRRIALLAQQSTAHEGPEHGRCVACWSRACNQVLLPCRHLCLCNICARSCRSTCPICRSTVSDMLEIFGVT
mmetsp:Transcript_98479/g.195334  ORF Transcript_98479/g.195334 Transcript_98479/m.195334 type:complete len:245 (-) Transcript_98479:64-798(-)